MPYKSFLFLPHLCYVGDYLLFCYNLSDSGPTTYVCTVQSLPTAYVSNLPTRYVYNLPTRYVYNLPTRYVGDRLSNQLPTRLSTTPRPKHCRSTHPAIFSPLLPLANY